MKIKTLLISIGTGALIIVGGVIAARQAAVRSRKPVEVMPVVNADLALQYASWGFDSDESMYGTIVSRDTQSVDLHIGDGQTLKSVSVKEGDEVKTGDVLMEYDVRKKLLEREAHDLALQLSRIGLKRLENELEEIRKKNPALFVDIEEAQKTASAQPLSPDGVIDADNIQAEKVSARSSVKSASVSEDEAADESLIEEETELISVTDKDGWLLGDSADSLYDMLLEDSMEGMLLASEDLPDGIQDGFDTSSDLTGETSVEGVLSDQAADDLEDGIASAGSAGTSLFDAVAGSSQDAVLDDAENTGDTTGENAGSDDLPDGIGEAPDVDPDDPSSVIEPDAGNEPAGDPAVTDEENPFGDEAADGLFDDEDQDGEAGTGTIDGAAGYGSAEELEDGFSFDDSDDTAEDLIDVPEAETDLPEGIMGDEDELSGEDEDLEEKIREATDFSIGTSDGNVSEGSLDNNTTDLSEESLQIQEDLRVFLRIMNLLTRQYTTDPTTLETADLEQARILYEKSLAKEETVRPFLDAFGESRSVPLFVPGTNTLKALKEMQDKYSDFSAVDTLKALHQGYANYLCYKLWLQMYLLEDLVETNPVDITSETAIAYSGSIRDAADTYYQLYFFWRYLKESVPTLANSSSLYEPLTDLYLDEVKALMISVISGSNGIIDDDLFATYPVLGKGYSGLLSILVSRLFEDSLLELEEIEEDTEFLTEDFDDFEGDDEDENESAQELRDMFFDKLIAIRLQRNAVRQAELDLKKDDEAIEKATVRASIDGVVRTAGTLEEGTSSTEKFIVVAGEMGMYAVGSVSEMNRDSISLGDIVTGTSEETGQEFTATVTEILDYPTTGEDDYYFYSSSSELTNSNASQYQFYAYIEDSTGLEEGYATLRFKKDETTQTGIMLEDYFVKEEDYGKYFVYIRGKDGKLKKQYVTVGKGSVFGSGKNIIDGLEYEDLIAFPADNIKEGDPTSEVDFLEDIYY